MSSILGGPLLTLSRLMLKMTSSASLRFSNKSLSSRQIESLALTSVPLGLTRMPLSLGLTSNPLSLGLTRIPLSLGLTSNPLSLGLTRIPLSLGLTRRSLLVWLTSIPLSLGLLQQAGEELLSNKIKKNLQLLSSVFMHDVYF